MVLCKWLHCDLWPFPQVSDPGPFGPSCHNYTQFTSYTSERRSSTQRQSARRAAPPPPTHQEAQTLTQVRSSQPQPAGVDSWVAKPKEIKTSATKPAVANTSVSVNVQQAATSNDIDSNRTTREQTANGVETNLTRMQHVDTTDTATSPLSSPTRWTVSCAPPASSLVDCRSVSVPDSLGYHLVEQVRNNTGLSFKASCVAVETVLNQISLHVPDVSLLMQRIHATLNKVCIPV